MRRSLLKSLMLFMLILGMSASAVHADDFTVCVDEPAAFEQGHASGDGDEVPADAGKAYPHHHASCSGHHAVDENVTPYSRTVTAYVVLGGDSPAEDMPSLATGPDLRPPIA